MRILLILVIAVAVSATSVVPQIPSQISIAKTINNVRCPSSQSECPANTTCCPGTNEQEGCCPLPEAVCCSDGLHCCPQDYTCDSAGICIKDGEVLVGVGITSSITSMSQSVICPGGTSECPDGNTCCKLASGQYGCCPIPNAVCCSDHLHCCPQGYTCDVSQGTCTRGSDLMNWLEKSPAKDITVKSVVCPGGTAECPDGNTCCKLASGQYGCCPIPNAVCCSDHLHCCPQGYTCDVSQGTCTRGSDLMTWFEKSPAKDITAESVVCPGGTAECPDGNTCCMLASGQYGCCPIPNAVCCSDHLHCCPQGYTCDVSQGTCTRGSDLMTWFEKSLSKDITAESVVCPGGTAECPDGNTCCMLASGQYGCCPIPNAVCCSDHLHCCPQGYTCDVSQGTCTRGSDLMTWFEKSSAKDITVKSVVCPGGTSECPDGNTCCMLASGQYGCCPIPNAVCCSDHLHCCPQGYTCDVSQGTCTRGSELMSWFEKSPAKDITVHVESVVCPGGTSECPDGNTCCKLASGQYGCCPIPNAVCCSDHLHCCPQGYTCDVSQGTCTRGSELMSWFEKSPAKDITVDSVVCPGGTAECPDGNTCCKLASGQYGCCPIPNAVCCSDHLHCCPQGYTCDVSQGTCTRGSELMSWFEKSPAKDITAESVVCPGGTAECPDGNTCCKLASGQYGCCPIPNAVCCSDHLHCCPQGYTCDVSQGTCTRGSELINWFEKSPAKDITVHVESVVCPGGTSECPDGNTCCMLASGQYGCCPIPNAVCCSDHLHCCPQGYTCDVSQGTCTRGSDLMTWFEKSSAKDITVKSVVCPGGTSECPDGNTCCMLASGQYGCCPIPNAVCCSDHLHCCPQGYTCDVSQGTCTRGIELMSWFEKSPAKDITVESVVCPGGTAECPDGNTCCKLASGQYGCCPIPNAVCCSDHLHCCPQGYTCDVSQGTCTRGSELINWFEKSPAKDITVHVESVVCPGGTSECPDGNTCCMLASGQYGCCPIPNAVCCSDHLHCCPQGYTCDVSQGTCTRGSDLMTWFEKSSAKDITVKSVVCPGGTSECPDGNTCCKLASGQYGCCPIPNAVCCSDHLHCCPQGYTCDVSQGTCTRGSDLMTWFEKSSAKDITVKSVVCPGGTAECPDGNTCCKLASGQYGCCPIPNAVCCSDHLHCCPQGYTCDVSQGTCTRGSDLMTWFEKSSAKDITVHVESVVCPGGTAECPDGNTCCKLASGQYGCCPIPNAVCCSDHLHCCPQGYTCDVSQGTCTRGSDLMTWFEKSPAKDITAESVVCPGGTAECPDGNTCCKLASGQYGCCPIPNAVCCSDHLHCCPQGYTCDVSQGTCTRGSELMNWFEKSPAKDITVKSVVCPGGTAECPDGNTCCKLASGQYGCCPIPNAVCCSDHLHCCPQGYTCDVSQGTCTRGSELMNWFEKSPAKDITVKSVVCPGGTAECPDGNTCCKLASGQYGCCPIPNAVCCSDHLHCCPQGYTCDVSQGTCTRGSELINWFEKSPAKDITVHVESVVCPGGTSECPDGNTCCKLASGQYGCCPIPNAVCCSDHLHCCPQGYTCDVSQGTCTRGSDLMTWFEKSSAKDITVKSVVCPGGTSECPDGNTCCMLTSGQYGCCPIPNAVCCSDHLHCCPQGYTCDVSQGTCTRGNEVVAWFEKSEASPVQSNSVACPGGEVECPDGNTCCQLKSGQYGCCPLLNAVCCSDGEHCCPSGYTCDVSAGSCTQGSHVVGWHSKTTPLKSGKKSKKNLDPCPDSKTSCPKSNTCCQTASEGEYGCCPLKNAVCCEDRTHCCPWGYTCGETSCEKGSRHLPILKKSTDLVDLTFDLIDLTSDPQEADHAEEVKHLLFRPEEPTGTQVVCPDGQSACPDGNTCCMLVTGQWGCCPLPKAVCCADKMHCCPSGYTCDSTTSACSKGLDHLPWLLKVPASSLQRSKVTAIIKPSANKIMCPDETSSCPDGSTCCQTPGGIYGCCPYQGAICCSDLIHCCPSGYTCQTSTGSCIKDSHVMPWAGKSPTL